MKKGNAKQTIAIILSVAMAVTSVNCLPLTAHAEISQVSTLTSSESTVSVLSGKTTATPEISYTGKEQSPIDCQHFFNISDKAQNKVEYKVAKAADVTAMGNTDSFGTSASYTLEIAPAEVSDVKASNNAGAKANKITVSKNELTAAGFSWSKYIYFKSEDGSWIQDLNADVTAYKGTKAAGKQKIRYAKTEMNDYSSLETGTYFFKLVIDSENVVLSKDAATIFVKVKVTAGKGKDDRTSDSSNEQETYIDEKGKLVLGENVQAGDKYLITASLIQEEATEAQLSPSLISGGKYTISAGNKTDQYLLDNIVYYQTENGELKEVLDQAGEYYADPDAAISIYQAKSSDDKTVQEEENSSDEENEMNAEAETVQNGQSISFNSQVTRLKSGSKDSFVKDETEYDDNKINIADLQGGKTYDLKLVINTPNVKNGSNQTEEHEFVVYVTVYIQRGIVSYIPFTPTDPDDDIR